MINYLKFVLVIAFGACNAQQPKEENLDAFIQKEAGSIFENQKLPGLFIGVLNNGKRSYYNFGYATPVTKTVFDSTTLFEAGSITKTFTAYILLSVLKEKGIDENAPVINYLPDSVKENKSLEHITFLKLLNHTSGLPRLPGNLDLASPQPYMNYHTNELFSYLKSATANTEGKSEYSNLGFGLAGTLAELISGKSYNDLLATYILLPLNVVSINKPGQKPASKKSQGFMGDKPVEYWEFDALGGAGELKITADEMLSYLDRIANPIASKDIVEKLLVPSATLSPRAKIGRAWIISESPGKPTVYWHNGGTYGFSTFAAFLKGQQKAVIVVVNQFNKNQASDKLGMMIMDKISR